MSATLSTPLLVSATCALGAVALFQAIRLFSQRSPLANVPGPPDVGWVFGYLLAILDEELTIPTQWIKDYGHVVAYTETFGQPAVYTDDLRAIQFILSQADAFHKSSFVRRLITSMLGKSLFVADGASHRAQRRVMNPGFGPAQVRELSGIFLDKANQMRDMWMAQLDGHAKPLRLDVCKDISRATLDMIGLAGFGYDFNALGRGAGDSDELTVAFETLTGVHASSIELGLLGALPGADYLPTSWQRARKKARKVLNRIGGKLISERKAVASASGKVDSGGRDLLSLLVRANMSENPAQRMSDEEVLAQVPTFIFAGHETTAAAVSWALFRLSEHADVQEQLRAELNALPLPTSARENEALDADTLAALDKLPLLDAVVRETLRVHPPAQTPDRVATRDTAIPLARPFTDRHGVSCDVLHVAKGDVITIPILTVHRSKELWGADANEWRPERWLSSPPEATHAVPGVWGHLLTFLGGTHACIGYRFALLEMKILLHALISTLQFELAVPATEIVKKSAGGLVIRPALRSAPEEGHQLPLLVSRAKVDEY